MRPVSRIPTAPKRPTVNAARQREVVLALADMEAACNQLDAAVRGVCKLHDPLGCLPFVLALSTGAIVAGVTVRSVRWYFALPLSFGGAVLIFLVLMAYRVASWSRHHPLLAEMYKLQHIRADEDADFDRIELSEVIVRRYLPEEQGEPLLARLKDTRQRTARLLGLDDYDSSRGQAGA